MGFFKPHNPAPPRAAGRRRMASHAGGARGFSLLEVALVLPLIGVLTAVGAMSMRQALAREEIDGWVRSMTYDIAAGRQAAITRRATVTLVMSNADGSNASAEHSARTYTLAVSGGGGTLRQATLPSDISMTTTCPVGSCSFDRRGVPIDAGAITVTSAATGRTYTINIAAGTGRVSYSEP